jgi:hypothetical protein
MKNPSIYKRIKQKDGTYKIKTYKGQNVVKEDVLHDNCVKWFRMSFGDWQDDNRNPMLCHIANETPRSSNVIQMIAYNRKMKRLGKITGIPDFFIRKYTGEVIFIELKAIDNKIKNEQQEIFSYFNAKNKQCFVCQTQDEFEKVCNDFMGEVGCFQLLE